MNEFEDYKDEDEIKKASRKKIREALWCCEEYSSGRIYSSDEYVSRSEKDYYKRLKEKALNYIDLLDRVKKLDFQTKKEIYEFARDWFE